MRALARLTCVAVICTCLGICAYLSVDVASAQPATMGCSSEQLPNAAQTLHCRGGVTIVAENGAAFRLRSHNRNGDVDSVDLQSGALLVDAPRQRGKSRFEVTTPQAIAAVRGTKWAVDTKETRTSVLVLRGQVAVRRPAGPAQVVLGSGQGVDVDPGMDPLIVKRWPQPRVDALLARLGQ
jgi:ferric-dicitrate binding protein FerR (iron transport regulator)